MRFDPGYWKLWFEFSSLERKAVRTLLYLLIAAIVVRTYVFFLYEPTVEFTSVPTQLEAMKQRGDNLDSNRSDSGFKFQRGPKSSQWHNSGDSDTISPVEKMLRSPEVFRKSLLVEINTADTLDFRRLPAIGPYLARKFVEYRERLGGFVSIEQLLEVYRMTLGKLDTIRPFLVLDTAWVERFDPNTVSPERLLKHPYLSPTQAKGFVNYRSKHGRFTCVEDLRKCLLIDEKTYEKIRDYVEVR